MFATLLFALLAPPASAEDAPASLVERPRTLAEALRQRNQQSKLRWIRLEAEPQAVAPAAAMAPASVEAYNTQFASLIQQRWVELIHNSNGIHPAGKLVVDFHLYPDGTIDGLRVAEGTAGKMFGLLCQQAILDPAPYPAWPRAVREEYGEGPRPVTLVFVHAAGDLSGPSFELRRSQDRLWCELRHQHRPMVAVTTTQPAEFPSHPFWPQRDSSLMETSQREDYRHWRREWHRQVEKFDCPRMDVRDCPVAMPSAPK